jgi:phage terminase small subunit
MATDLPQGSSHISGRPLTNSQHERFAHLVTKGESPARAILCGYSEHGALQSGNRLLRKPDVAARAEELKAAVSERQVEKMAVDSRVGDGEADRERPARHASRAGPGP